MFATDKLIPIILFVVVLILLFSNLFKTYKEYHSCIYTIEKPTTLEEAKSEIDNVVKTCDKNMCKVTITIKTDKNYSTLK